jgi:hypothetical protein
MSRAAVVITARRPAAPWSGQWEWIPRWSVPVLSGKGAVMHPSPEYLYVTMVREERERQAEYQRLVALRRSNRDCITVALPQSKTVIGSEWAKRHLRIRARSATGQIAGAATQQHGLATHHINTGLPTLLHSQRPCPGRSHRMPTNAPPKAERPTRPTTLDLSYRLTTGPRTPTSPPEHANERCAGSAFHVRTQGRSPVR